MYRIFLSFFIASILISPLAQASDIFQYSASNIQILRGHNYELGEKQRTIITLEHAHGHKYGDTFGFFDLIKADGQDHTYYGELSPRLSLSKMTGYDFSYGIIKDLLISTTFEKAKDQGPQYLYGGAIDLNLPGFKFFKANAYIHDSTELDGETWQVTLSWNRPFEIGGVKLLAEGFADFQGDEGGRSPNQLIVPRLLVDIGDLAGYEQGKLMAGVEYSYWNNKFGIQGSDESVPQAQLKWNF